MSEARSLASNTCLYGVVDRPLYRYHYAPADHVTAVTGAP
jgi:hypothetical protein